ncbi:low temperature requirement protein A [Agromyces aurantiacus]|uniref:Low temperature requirement protein A n=1 Tax=Agromyces aurantiacus TaxID=165814 RepID=A0ABV9R7I8_9MICO|nr:low temperature requirement protein A [Agromyces aurantiacus]MBM7502961.1 low temperature requirement protein LtrA [Agromyces aurantiacus]
MTEIGRPVLLRRAVMRDHDVEERAATPLELFFDLCFVVAVAFLAAEFHHGIADGHAWEAALVSALLFIPIWWAWMSYTWYATAFSHDDPVTRILTMAQMAGVLAVAAAVPAAAHGDVVPFALAYTAMRLPLVVSWLRSAAADAAHRAFALTYAIGTVVAQVLWLVGAFAGAPWQWPVFALALAVELVTPVLAVRRSPGPVFHPRHIAERYGLFTIIVLGETVLAIAYGLADAADELFLDLPVIVTTGSALALAFALWWLYFDALGGDPLERSRTAAFVWGYGHYVLFAAIAAIGAGFRAQLEIDAGHGVAGAAGVAVVAASGAISLAAIAWLRRVAGSERRVWHLLVSAAGCLGLALAAPWLPTQATAAGTAVVAGAAVAVHVLVVAPREAGSTTGRRHAAR